MPEIHVTATETIAAPAEVVYGILADYRVGHPAILPPKYFRSLVVEQGGTGAGTRIRFEMVAAGRTHEVRADITEPVPGRELVETALHNGAITRFLVEPAPDPGSCRVTFETRYQAPGVRGWLESLLVPGFLRTVYRDEMALLRARATRGAGGGGAY